MIKFLFLFFMAILIFTVIEYFLKFIQQGETFDIKSIKRSIRQSGKSVWQGLQLFVVIWILYLIVSFLLRSCN